MKIARRIQLLRQDGWYANHAGDTLAAERHYLAAYDLASDMSKEAALICNILADFYCDLGRHADAERFARRGLELQRTLGSQILIGNDLMMLAMVLEESGKPSEAEPFALEGSQIYESEYGVDHSETVRMKSVLLRIQDRIERNADG